MLRGMVERGRKCRVRRRQEGFDWVVHWQKTDRSGSPYRLFDSIKPTHSISLRALRRPTTYTHRQRERERERERERDRQSLPWKSIGDPNETHSYLVSTLLELSSLFVKINLWLPLNHISASEIGKCREARFLRSSVSL